MAHHCRDMTTPAKTQDQILDNYKRALAHANGKQYAAETDVDYHNGWFRVRHVNGTESKYRRRQILFFTESLFDSDFDSDAYDRAIEERQEAARRKANQMEVQRQLKANPHPASKAPTQNIRRGFIFNLIVLAVSVGVIWWCTSDLQGSKRKEAVAQEASRKAEQDAWNKKWETEQASRGSADPSTQSRFFPDPNSGFKTVLGILGVGTKLYSKSNYQFYGVVTEIEGGNVEVALADSVSVDDRGAHGYAVWLDRAYITENFVTKK